MNIGFPLDVVDSVHGFSPHRSGDCQRFYKNKLYFNCNGWWNKYNKPRKGYTHAMKKNLLLTDLISINWNRIMQAVADHKEECIQFIKKYINLGAEYRSFGIAPFEKECGISQNKFEKIALEMIINGDCPEYCFTVLNNLLLSSYLSNFDYFCNIVIFQFILLEYNDDISVSLLIKLLGSMLGLDHFYELKSEYTEYFHDFADTV